MERAIEERLSTTDLVKAGENEEQRQSRGRGDQTNGSGPLLEPGLVEQFRSRWDEIQTGFVDEPRESVHRADELVANAIKRLAESFAEERQRLEHQWDRGDNVDTEELRLALQKYRSFFQRLLSM